ncbi:hypothetical protein NS365_13325 [Aureimonas ureilytica]|uniref:Uncharacterized protein n=1 Tax=Aureimonas ureilytica TaxID=401562 RepID=A0A175RPW4_9HYPH|nr:hypothetical protein [Aureimonas ureilytica]KTR05004.1 hypothetical protein NS365_13325 [Aureimonas ureilytica]
MTAFVGAQLGEKWTQAQLTGAESGSVPGIGDIYVSHDNRRYRFVQYNAGVNVPGVKGNVAGFYAPGGVSTGLTNVVTSDVSETAGLGAGILMSDVASGEYCWIQIGGLATLTPALVSGASGQSLVLSTTTDGTLKVAAAVTDSVVAYAVNAAGKQVMCSFPY